MHIPAEKVWREMAREPAYLWFVPAIGSDTLAILVKAPTNSIKAIINGCKLEFVLGVRVARTKSYLGIVARIYDVTSAPLNILKLQRMRKEHKALAAVLARSTTPIFFFDELSRCVAWGYCDFELNDRSEALNLISDIENLFVGRMNQACQTTLDCLQVSVDDTFNAPNVTRISTATLTSRLTDIQTIEHHAYGVYQTHTYDIRHENEGAAQEVSVWHALETLFPFGLHRGPLVQEGESTRELIDVLCVYELGTFLFESKVLAVYKAGPNRSMERRVMLTHKHIRKALAQIRGALRTIREGGLIKGSSGRRLEIDANIPPHCAVLIPELLQFGDWNDIVNDCLASSCELKALIQILDVRELVTLARISSSPEEFDYSLSERFDAFAKDRTPFVRMQPGKLPKS